MPTVSPRAVEFRSVKQLVNRFKLKERQGNNIPISVEDTEVPTWQRQLVWTEEEQGLLIYSICMNYPIGMMVLWHKPNDIRVPIDGRQRLYAIKRFFENRLAIPDLPSVDEELRKAKLAPSQEDIDRGFKEMPLQFRDLLEDYELSIYEFENIAEPVAMDIFVRLQGGKSLNKVEIRAALGGKLCDFVSSLTSSGSGQDEDEEDADAEPSQHPFFAQLAPNVRNTRKAHRNVCDVLLHEFLHPDSDKHWSSLESMYRDKASTFSEDEGTRFRTELGRFHRAVQTTVNGERIIIPQLRRVHFIMSVFKAWRQLTQSYALPPDMDFAKCIAGFETRRQEEPEEYPNVNFTAALSNAGYAASRIRTRHDILMSYILGRYPNMALKDPNRSFTIEQKIAIWERAEHQCEWVDPETGQRCEMRFKNPRDADADHIVKHRHGGPTTMDNARLLCQRHNRADAP